MVVGAGPTGVELAGTLKEMARQTLPRDFRHIRTDRARVVLVEAASTLLSSFHPELQARARESLEPSAWNCAWAGRSPRWTPPA